MTSARIPRNDLRMHPAQTGKPWRIYSHLKMQPGRSSHLRRVPQVSILRPGKHAPNPSFERESSLSSPRSGRRDCSPRRKPWDPDHPETNSPGRGVRSAPEPEPVDLMRTALPSLAFTHNKSAKARSREPGAPGLDSETWETRPQSIIRTRVFTHQPAQRAADCSPRRKPWDPDHPETNSPGRGERSAPEPAPGTSQEPPLQLSPAPNQKTTALPQNRSTGPVDMRPFEFRISRMF
jgi:hypothetical protein